MGTHQTSIAMISGTNVVTNSFRALAFLTLVISTVVAQADTPILIYIYSPECGACRQFDIEIETTYLKTEESARLPMQKVLLDDWNSGVTKYAECAVAPVVSTPTFIQASGCQELDRITGYSDQELFWLSLARMINRLTANHHDSNEQSDSSY